MFNPKRNHEISPTYLNRCEKKPRSSPRGFKTITTKRNYEVVGRTAFRENVPQKLVATG